MNRLRGRKHLYVLLGVLLPITAGSVDIYESTDARGNVMFSDQPDTDSTKVDLPPLNTYEPMAVSQPPTAAPITPPVAAKTTLTIVSPAPQQSIWSGSGDIGVEISLAAPLNMSAGDGIQVLLDGKPVGPIRSSTAFELANVYRGAHTLQALVVNKKGEPLARSAPVTFYVHRPSRLFPKPAK